MDKNFQQKIKHIKKQIGETAGLLGVWRITLENPDGSKKVRYYHNVVPIVGRTLITNNLTDPTPDNDMLVSHVALGDDDTAVSESDTTLGNEVYRNAVASRTNSGHIAYVTGFFNQTEVDGTFKEAAIFSDGEAGADTGIMLSHVNINVTKTNVQKLTIDWTLTLLSA